MDIHSADWCRDPSGGERRRLLPAAGRAHFDPFTSFEHFRLVEGASLAARPCRGQEILTLLLAGSTRVSHGPCLMQPGDVHRLTSGQGAVMGPWRAVNGPAEGLRLCMCLPRRLLRVHTGQQRVSSAEIPAHTVSGAHQCVIAGPGSPLRLLTPLDCRLLRLSPSDGFDPQVLPGWRLKLYLLHGLVEVEGRWLKPGHVLCVSSPEGIRLRAVMDSRLFMAASLPLEEPVG